MDPLTLLIVVLIVVAIFVGWQNPAGMPQNWLGLLLTIVVVILLFKYLL